MDWKQRVLRMGERYSKRRRSNTKDPWSALDRADVLWIVWGTDGSVPQFRVVRGRALVGPVLRHGVVVVGNEVSGLDFVERLGDRIAVMDDGETPGIPEPAVPQAHIDMVMADQVQLYDGSVLKFTTSGLPAALSTKP